MGEVSLLQNTSQRDNLLSLRSALQLRIKTGHAKMVNAHSATHAPCDEARRICADMKELQDHKRAAAIGAVRLRSALRDSIISQHC